MQGTSTETKSNISDSSHDIVTSFTETDHLVMAMAMAEASEALIRGDLPVGAALVFNGTVIGTDRNSNSSDNCWSSHAEHKLILRNSKLITKNLRNCTGKVELFTTVEPCMMCFGAAIFHRISRIVFALPDSETGFTHIGFGKLSPWYQKAWPIVESGLYESASADLIEKYRTR